MADNILDMRNQQKSNRQSNRGDMESSRQSFLSTHQIAERHKQAFGPEYRLHSIQQIGYPLLTTTLAVTALGKPEDTIQEIHRIFLRLVKAEIQTTEALTQFLGLNEGDFVLDELLTLRKNNLLVSGASGYELSERGEEFLLKNYFIPVHSREEYRFCFDGVTKQVIPDVQGKEMQQSEWCIPAFAERANHNLITAHWSEIVQRYAIDNPGKELSGLADGKRSTRQTKVIYEMLYLLIFLPAPGNEAPVKTKLINSTGKEWKEQKTHVEDWVLSRLEGNEQPVSLPKVEFLTNDTMPVRARVTDILGLLDSEELIKQSFKTGSDILWEVPRLFDIGRHYLKEITSYLKARKKLTLLYGLKGYEGHHQGIVTDLENLQREYQNFRLIHLPDHLSTLDTNLTGTHQRIFIKDKEFYLYTSANWFNLTNRPGAKQAFELVIRVNEQVEAMRTKILTAYRLDS